ncbi:hypothetical protein CRG98_000299 [Punica granatum]|uniref:Uncharacterized protein n=1 Tax=Punica granatum TaxID=22663 RepID=A0A2I0LF38_PUNGR|nr:hypothetical protein CRG98_000299 [Punica granatum]
MSIKSDWILPHNAIDELFKLLGEIVSGEHSLSKDYYEAKKIVSKLGLVKYKIDCCKNGCMLYYKNEAKVTAFNFYGSSQYMERFARAWDSCKRVPVKRMHYLPIIPRFQRLFASMSSASHMTWHYENRREDGVMCHPSCAHLNFNLVGARNARTYAMRFGSVHLPGDTQRTHMRMNRHLPIYDRRSRAGKLPESTGMGCNYYAKAMVVRNRKFLIRGFYYVRAYIPYALSVL